MLLIEEMDPKRAMTAASWGTDSVSSVQGFLVRLWVAFLRSLLEFVAMRFCIAVSSKGTGGETAAAAAAAVDEDTNILMDAGLASVRALLSSRSRSERSAATF